MQKLPSLAITVVLTPVTDLQEWSDLRRVAGSSGKDPRRAHDREALTRLLVAHVSNAESRSRSEHLPCYSFSIPPILTIFQPLSLPGPPLPFSLSFFVACFLPLIITNFQLRACSEACARVKIGRLKIPTPIARSTLQRNFVLCSESYLGLFCRPHRNQHKKNILSLVVC